MPTAEHDWTTCRALVTGATGYIGRHLVRRLAAMGCEVHAVSREPLAGLPDGLSGHAVDLTDHTAVAELVRTERPDVVYHLAGLVSGGREPELVLPTLRANLLTTVHLLDVATEFDGMRVVLAGSIEEVAELCSVSPYATAKRSATAYARLYHQLWNVPVTVLRIAMVFGPGEQEPRRLLPYVTACAMTGERPRLGSGDRLVDWVYIDDVVDAFVATASSERAPGAVLDIGSGTPVSINDTIHLLLDVLDRPVRPEFGALPDRPFDAPQRADIRPAARVLGWRPQVSLEEGLRRTAAWFAENLNQMPSR